MPDNRKQVHAIQLNDIAERRITRKDCKKFLEMHGAYFEDYVFIGDMTGNGMFFCAIYFTDFNHSDSALEGTISNQDFIKNHSVEPSCIYFTVGDYFVFDDKQFLKVDKYTFENHYELIPEDVCVELNLGDE